MKVFPARSAGVRYASVGAVMVAYDLVTQTRHRMSPAAGLVLDACDGVTAPEVAVAGWADEAGVDPATVAATVQVALERFTEIGLVGRATAWQAPPARSGAPAPDSATVAVGAEHRVLARTVRFWGEDAALVEQLDAYLGTGVPAPSASAGRSPTDAGVVWFWVGPRSGGGFDLVTDERVGHATLETLLRRSVTVMNEYATQNDDHVTLHAGAVRSPAGRIVVLPAVIDAGKSTLTAALIGAGWDYLGDEVVGVDGDGVAYGYPKPLALDAGSRRVVGLGPDPDPNVVPTDLRAGVVRLGGPVGPVDRVIFPTFRPGAHLEVTEVDGPDGLDRLLMNTLNLARVGQRGFEALCRLAAEVPRCTLVHGGAVEAAEAITELVDGAPTTSAAGRSG